MHSQWLMVSLIANTAEQLLIIINCVKGKERESEVDTEIIKIQASASALFSFNLLTFIYSVQGVKPLLCCYSEINILFIFSFFKQWGLTLCYLKTSLQGPYSRICPNSHNLFLLPSQGCSGKIYPCHCKRHKSVGLILRLERSLGVENGNPLQYSCLENSMDREVWQHTVHGVSKSGTGLSNWAQYTATTKEMLQI